MIETDRTILQIMIAKQFEGPREHPEKDVQSCEEA